MEIQPGFIDADDGTGARLFYRSIDPDGRVKATIVFAHGYAEHSGRYERHMAALAQAGYAVIAPDHRGHGRSASTLGLIERFDALVSDLSTYCAMASERHAGKPVFLLGHSMGGMATLLNIVRHAPEVRGAIVIAPAIEVPDNIPAIMLRIAKVLSRIVPKLPVQAFFDPTKLSSRPEIQQAVLDDPLFYRGKVRARTGAELYAAMLDINAHLDAVAVPLLLLHGSADRIVSPRTSDTVYAAVKSSDKTLEVFDDARHELLNETCEDDVMEVITAWLDERSG